jgi:YD repeat-containing protein
VTLGSLVTFVYNEYYSDGTVKQSLDRAGAVTSYTHDKLKRLLTRGVLNNGQSQATTWTYDPVGNVKTPETPNHDVTTYAYDDLNRLRFETITVNGASQARTYAHDPGEENGTGLITTNLSRLSFP